MLRLILVLGILVFASPSYGQFGKKLKKFSEKVQQKLDQEVDALSNNDKAESPASDSTTSSSNKTFIGNKLAELN